MSNYKYKHGLCVMRAQPFHIGHQKIIDKMLHECELVTIALGSIQESHTEHNPFDYNIRQQMIENVYRDNKEFSRLNICGISDINNPPKWGEYVVSCLKENFSQNTLPDVYYAGSEEDASLLSPYFSYTVIVDRNDKSFPYVSGTMVRDMIKQKDNRWKNFVPSKNHVLVEEYFYNTIN